MRVLNGISSAFFSLVEYAKRNYVPVFFVITVLIMLSKVTVEKIFGIFIEQLFYSTQVIVWWLIIERRLINKRMKNAIRWIAILMVLLLTVQFFRYDILIKYITASRVCWYLYYIPFTLFPILIFYIAYNIDKSDYDEIDKRLYLLLIPAVLLFLMVVTNDLHEFVFIFDPAYPIEDEVYSYGFGMYLIIGWFIIMATIDTVLMVKKTIVAKVTPKMFLAVIPIVFGVVACFLSFTNNLPSLLDGKLFNLPEAMVFTAIAVIECLIQIGLLPSNRRYRMFFENSSLLAQIENTSGEVVYSSENARKLENSVSKGFASREDYKLRSMPIPGGSVYWVDDHTEINKLNRDIQHITEQLEEGNELKKSENKIKEEAARYETLNLVYDEISRETAAQAKKVRRILESSTGEGDFKEKLALAALYNVYIKRQSNLILLSQETGILESKEMVLALNETVEFLKYNGILAGLNSGASSKISALAAIETFKMVHEIIDGMIPGAKACFVFIEAKEGVLKVRLMIDGATKLPAPKSNKMYQLSVSGDNESATVTIVFDDKGAIKV